MASKKASSKTVRKNLATDEKVAVEAAMREINELYHIMTNKINALNSYYAPILGDNRDEMSKL